MPVIKNIDSVSHHYNGEVFPPGEERIIQYFPPRDEPWVSVISEEPRVPPVCLDAGVISISENCEEEIDIPMCHSFRASFICVAGGAEARQNYPEVNAVSLTPDIEYEITCRRADVEKIILTGLSDAVVQYDIERVL
jgi:hypothetical protein